MDAASARFTGAAAERIAGLLARCTFPPPGTAVACAVSGGADSTALALLAVEAGCVVTIVHVDHQLRPTSADDAALVQRTAAVLGVPCTVHAVAVGDGPNLEARARAARYGVLPPDVLTGHTADDQAETVLHRMIRGSGIRGLRGIAPVRPLAEGIRLVRPMLGLTRADVLDHLRLTGQSWREDASNRDPAHTRNRIRHELIPLLRTFNPQLGEALNRLADQAREACEGIDARAAVLLGLAELPKAGRLVILKRDPLAPLNDADLRELLRRVWEREEWPMGGMSHEHWERAVRVARGELTACDMPDGISLRAAGNLLRIGPRAGGS